MLHHDLKVQLLYTTLSRKKTLTQSNCRWLTSFFNYMEQHSSNICKTVQKQPPTAFLKETLPSVVTVDCFRGYTGKQTRKLIQTEKLTMHFFTFFFPSGSVQHTHFLAQSHTHKGMLELVKWQPKGQKAAATKIKTCEITDLFHYQNQGTEKGT